MELESQLSDGDYKIIKCAEAQAVGDPLPYDAAKLHADRQAKRDRINAIEDEIAELEAIEPDEETPQGDGSTGSSQGGGSDNQGDNANQGGSGGDFGGN